VFIFSWTDVALFHPQALVFLIVAFCDSHAFIEGTRTDPTSGECYFQKNPYVKVNIYFSQEEGRPVTPPGIWFHFWSPLTTPRATVNVL
jgi:hypothetical protein